MLIYLLTNKYYPYQLHYYTTLQYIAIKSGYYDSNITIPQPK